MTALTVSSFAVPTKERRNATRSVRSIVIHPGKINLITQVRKTYFGESINALADSIAELGQIELPVLAELDMSHVGPYLEYFNRVLGSGVQIKDLVVDYQTGHYFIAICGHRRTKACDILWTLGCSVCREKYDKKAASKCIRAHGLAIAGMEARARFNIDPAVALQLQIAENTKESVLPEDEAEALRADYEALRAADPGLTKTAFARKLNLMPTAVTCALRFCDLPEEVKRSYREKFIPFSTAVELWRLQDAGLEPSAITSTLSRIVAAGMKTDQARKYVSGILKARAPGAADSYSLFDELEDTGQVGEIRRSVEQTAHIAFHAEVLALRKTQSAMEGGILPVIDVTRDPLVRRSIAEGTELREKIDILVETG